MDTLLRNARILGRDYAATFDVGIEAGRISAIEPAGVMPARGAARPIDLDGRLLAPSFVETHIHLDKSCILDRCTSEKGTLDEAISQVALQKQSFTAEDVAGRARRTLEKAIAQGTGVMRTHVEVDPVVGLRGLDGVMSLVDEYRWAIDIEVCVFPQEGLLNNPGTDELLVAGMKQGARVIGAAPYCDSDPHAQIDRIFDIAREFDADIDMHVDSGPTAEHLDTLLVCDLAEKYKWGGRVAVGHVGKLSTMPFKDLDRVAKRMADTGVAATVLTATDLYLGGRHTDHNVPRNVLDLNFLTERGVTCSVASNNILNPFTPFGDGQLLRQVNMHAIVTQRANDDEVKALWDMTTKSAAKLMRKDDYGIAIGGPADLVVLDAPDAVMALRTIAPVLAAYKRGRRTVTREPVQLHRP